MGKYIDVTVYEKFTGCKPPEPKLMKPKRKRGFGHPYRMRLTVDSTHHSVSDFSKKNHY